MSLGLVVLEAVMVPEFNVKPPDIEMTDEVELPLAISKTAPCPAIVLFRIKLPPMTKLADVLAVKTILPVPVSVMVKSPLTMVSAPTKFTELVWLGQFQIK